jgi:hypothetical protein
LSGRGCSRRDLGNAAADGLEACPGPRVASYRVDLGGLEGSGHVESFLEMSVEPHEEIGGRLIADLPQGGHDRGHSGGQKGAGEAFNPFGARDPAGGRIATGEHHEPGAGKMLLQNVPGIEHAMDRIAGVLREEHLGEQREV